jgi:hypothetical protein
MVHGTALKILTTETSEIGEAIVDNIIDSKSRSGKRETEGFMLLSVK